MHLTFPFNKKTLFKPEETQRIQGLILVKQVNRVSIDTDYILSGMLNIY